MLLLLFSFAPSLHNKPYLVKNFNLFAFHYKMNTMAVMVALPAYCGAKTMRNFRSGQRSSEDKIWLTCAITKKCVKKLKKQKNNGNEVINFAAKLAFVCMFVWVCVCAFKSFFRLRNLVSYKICSFFKFLRKSYFVMLDIICFMYVCMCVYTYVCVCAEIQGTVIN